MTAIAALRAMPETFVELLMEANPACFTMDYHSMDTPLRPLDLVEMYSGSARISTFAEKAGCLDS